MVYYVLCQLRSEAEIKRYTTCLKVECANCCATLARHHPRNLRSQFFSRIFTYILSIAILFLSLLLDVHKGEYFAHACKPRFIGLTILCGLLHIRLTLVLLQANNSVGFEYIVRIAQKILKVSHKLLTSVTD